MHGRFGASLTCMRNREQSGGDRRRRGSRWRIHPKANWSCLSFPDTQTFLFTELSARRADREREDCLPLAARRRVAAPGWHQKLRQFGFNSGHLLIDSREAPLSEVLRGFLPSRGGINQLHVTTSKEACLTPDNSQRRKFSCPSEQFVTRMRSPLAQRITKKALPQ